MGRPPSRKQRPRRRLGDVVRVPLAFVRASDGFACAPEDFALGAERFVSGPEGFARGTMASRAALDRNSSRKSAFARRPSGGRKDGESDPSAREAIFPMREERAVPREASKVAREALEGRPEPF
jgi:hypothetical protein